MAATFLWLTFFALANAFMSTMGTNPHTRELDKIAGDEAFRREIGNIKEASVNDEYPRIDGQNKGPSKYQSGTLDSIGGGHLLRSERPDEEELVKLLIRLIMEQQLENSEQYKERGLLTLLDRLSNGEISRTLNNVDASDFLMALEEAQKEEDGYRHKRALDSIAGVTFGEMKRMIPMKGFGKRNFDEIDNVGFNNWAKRPYDANKDKKTTSRSRMQTLALARRNFGGPQRYHLSSLAKKNFDEIDRTGFEGFSKREI